MQNNIKTACLTACKLITTLPTVLQEPRLRLDFLGRNVSSHGSFRNSGPQLPHTSTNTGLFMTKINRKSCCRSLDEGR